MKVRNPGLKVPRERITFRRSKARRFHRFSLSWFGGSAVRHSQLRCAGKQKTQNAFAAEGVVSPKKVPRGFKGAGKRRFPCRVSFRWRAIYLAIDLGPFRR